MNAIILDALFLVVGIALVLICAKRGFFKALFKTARIILAAVAAYFWGSALGSFICGRYLSEPIRQTIYDKVLAIYQSSVESFDVEKSLSAIPEFLLTDSLREELANLGESGMDLVNSTADSMASSVTGLVSSVIGYAGVFLIAWVVLLIAGVIIGKLIEGITLLRLADSLLGAVLGLVIATVVLFIAGSTVKHFFGGEEFYTKSVVATFFGDATLLERISFLNLDAWLEKATEMINKTKA